MAQPLSLQRRYRLAIVHTHPIEYYGPLFAELARQPEIDLTVYYGSRLGVDYGYDPEFEIYFRWDRPLLEGYRYLFLRNIVPTRLTHGLTGPVTPGLVWEILRKDYDAVLVYGWANVQSWLAFLTCWLTGRPYLVAGDSTLLRPRPLGVRVFKQLLLRPLFKRAGAILTMGAANEALYRHYGVPSEKFFLVPYSPDVQYFRCRSEDLRAQRVQIKQKYGIPASGFVILFVGKLVARKRPQDLLEAFHLVERRIKKVSLVFVGEGPLKPSLQEYSVNHGLEDKVKFIGFKNQSEMPETYVMADVLVLPSDYEPWGVVLNEAMACGLPVVVSDMVGASRESRFLQHGYNGYVYPVGDIVSLADYLTVLAQNVDLRVQMGSAAVDTVGEWNYSLCVRGIIDALHYAVKN